MISIYEGLQRVVLFTSEQRVYKLLCESEKVQLAEQEIILSLKNVGVSLVNNSSSQEVSFIGITRWERQTCLLTDLPACLPTHLFTNTVSLTWAQLRRGVGVEAEEEGPLEDAEHQRSRHAGEELQGVRGVQPSGPHHRGPGQLPGQSPALLKDRRSRFPSF